MHEGSIYFLQIAHERGISFFITRDSLGGPRIVIVCWKKRDLCVSLDGSRYTHCFGIGATVYRIVLIFLKFGHGLNLSAIEVETQARWTRLTY